MTTFAIRFQWLILLYSLTPLSFADSVKYLQWWDEYLPQREESTAALGYNRDYTIKHFQDYNDDGVANDTIICQPFRLDQYFNPPQQCPQEGSWDHYRTDRPSAVFYGGMEAKYLNVSDITRTNRDDEEVPLFSRFPQSTVQNDGATMNAYNTRFPHNIRRALFKNGGPFWADITLFVLDPAWTTISKAFYEKADSKANFAAVFLWKKENFVNGGASAEKIVFDETSKIMVDMTRQPTAEQGRFVLQEQGQLWISEHFFTVDESVTRQLNPLASKWAKYHPEGCDIAFDEDAATFVDHTFTDVQAAGVYLANHEFVRPLDDEGEPHKLVFIFDNFQLYATEQSVVDQATDQAQTEDKAEEDTVRTIEFPRNPDHDVIAYPGLMITPDNEIKTSETTFSQGITVNGSKTTIRSHDQLDIRGVIRPVEAHLEQPVDIFVIVGHRPHPQAEWSLFMLDDQGGAERWNGDIAELIAFVPEVTLTPEYRLQILPVSIEHFKKRKETMDNLLLGCEPRPLTFNGVVGDVTGEVGIYYGYRLAEGSVVFNKSPISFDIVPSKTVK